jgi:uncharacterized phiE125 gp8 family phage protein
MTHSRQHLTTDPPVLLAEVKARARAFDDADNFELQHLADAAAHEIEDHTGLALMGQIVTVTLCAWCKRIPLPVGPFWTEGLPAHPVTVELLDEAGNATAHPAGWWIEPGRYPVLNLTGAGHGTALRIRYPAGYGTTSDSIPADLQLAVADQAARLFDVRGMDEAAQGLSLAAARITARHRRVAI